VLPLLRGKGKSSVPAVLCEGLGCVGAGGEALRSCPGRRVGRRGKATSADGLSCPGPLGSRTDTRSRGSSPGASGAWLGLAVEEASLCPEREAVLWLNTETRALGIRPGIGPCVHPPSESTGKMLPVRAWSGA